MSLRGTVDERLGLGVERRVPERPGDTWCHDCRQRYSRLVPSKMIQFFEPLLSNPLFRAPFSFLLPQLPLPLWLR